MRATPSETVDATTELEEAHSIRLYRIPYRLIGGMIDQKINKSGENIQRG
jgi:hypothetical protein